MSHPTDRAWGSTYKPGGHWTTEAPSEPGWYWIKMIGCVEIARVRELRIGGSLRFYCTQDEDTDGWGMHKADMWWSEPVVVPLQPEER